MSLQKKKRQSAAFKRLDAQRKNTVKNLTDPIYESLYESPLAYTMGPAHAFNDFIKDPSAENLATLTAFAVEYYQQEKRRKA